VKEVEPESAPFWPGVDPEEPKEYTLRSLLRGDFRRWAQLRELSSRARINYYAEAAQPPPAPTLPLRPRLSIIFASTSISVVLYRLAHAAHRRRLPLVPRILTDLNLALYSVEIDPKAVIGPGFSIGHLAGTAIGSARLGRNVTTLGKVTIGARGMADSTLDGLPEIGDNVWFFHGSSAWGPIHVGDGTRIGANAALTESVPPGSMVVAPKSKVIVNPVSHW
jgi:serine O-acetyltransferase